MKLKSLAALAALSTIAMTASAQTYVEAGVTSVSYEERVLGYDFESSPRAFRVIVGRELDQTFSVEGLVAMGMGDDGIKVVGTSIPTATFEVDNVFGLYVRAKTEIANDLEGFARIGVARSKGTARILGVSASASETGLSYGLGVSYKLDKTSYLTADYMSYLNRSNSKATGITVGLGFKF